MSPALSKDLINDQIEKKDAIIQSNSVKHCDQENRANMSILKRSNSLEQAVHSFYKRLTSLSTFEPCEEANKIFHELVNFIVKKSNLDDAFEILMQSNDIIEICRNYHKICSKAESALEAHWAKSIVAGQRNMTTFPYHDNYIHLTRLEYHLLCGQGARPKHVMFIGSGPLPMSCLILAQQHLAPSWSNDDWSILNVDICPEVNLLAGQVSKKTLPQHIRYFSFMTCDAAEIDAAVIQQYDVIYLAALVGLNGTDKEAIVRHLAVSMRSGSRLLVRSAVGLRRLLYPQISEQSLITAGDGRLVVEVICHPRNDVINSVMIARIV